MFRITDSLATHGLGDKSYPMTEKDLVSGKKLQFPLNDWIIVDCRDLLDEYNPPMRYAEKILEVDDYIFDTYTKSKCVVCCGAGMSRSNAVALGYLLYKGMTWDEAWKLIHAEGSIAQIESGHLHALRQLFNIRDTFRGHVLDFAEGDYYLEEKNSKILGETKDKCWEGGQIPKNLLNKNED